MKSRNIRYSGYKKKSLGHATQVGCYSILTNEFTENPKDLQFIGMIQIFDVCFQAD